jgi:hypothetical protein
MASDSSGFSLVGGVYPGADSLAGDPQMVLDNLTVSQVSGATSTVLLLAASVGGWPCCGDGFLSNLNGNLPSAAMTRSRLNHF